uniref:Uncharacterized protein n=1 Tax=Vespula pensylvanica TaxID=30213 RepID=A0A834P2N0_VESPE|nr:hypothetical protein H0235_008215 [Vespula pensylvanica]
MNGKGVPLVLIETKLPPVNYHKPFERNSELGLSPLASSEICDPAFYVRSEEEDFRWGIGRDPGSTRALLEKTFYLFLTERDLSFLLSNGDI